MPASVPHLDQRILPDYEFTLRDEVIIQLLDFIRCPTLMEVSPDSVIFRKQCYNRNSWMRWLDEENEWDMGRRKSGYGPTQCDRLNDPVSGEDVGFRHSVRHDYHIEVAREKM